MLEPLFFELLNTSIPRRKGKFAQEAIYNQIPYLNGGLFSPHIDDHYKFSPELQSGQYGLVTIPNDWFDRFYAVLGQYNFTVDENTSYDIELSIDPEMLGRILKTYLQKSIRKPAKTQRRVPAVFIRREISSIIWLTAVSLSILKQNGNFGRKVESTHKLRQGR